MGKTLLYILTDKKGGVEEYLLNLSRYSQNPQDKFGYLIAGESKTYEKELNDLGVEYYYIPKKKRLISNIKAYRNILKKCRKEYDTIYFNTSGLYYPIPYIFAILNNYRIVLHSHLTSGSGLKKLIHIINRIWINKATNVKLACSSPAGEWMFGEKSSYTIIPNAIDINRFRFNKNNRDTFRKKNGIDDKAIILGNVGRLHPVKNQLFLVDLLDYMVRKGEDAILLLVGDGDMRSTIIQKAERLNLKDRVILIGQTNEPYLYYSVMDCLVMPSLVEGFPITLVEAQANGIPCVVSDNITKETNITGHVQYVSLSDNYSVWYKAIRKDSNRYSDERVLREKGFDLTNIYSRISSIIGLEEKHGE